jgi:hypothetical protein
MSLDGATSAPAKPRTFIWSLVRAPAQTILEGQATFLPGSVLTSNLDCEVFLLSQPLLR